MLRCSCVLNAILLVLRFSAPGAPLFTLQLLDCYEDCLTYQGIRVGTIETEQGNRRSGIIGCGSCVCSDRCSRYGSTHSCQGWPGKPRGHHLEDTRFLYWVENGAKSRKEWRWKLRNCRAILREVINNEALQARVALKSRKVGLMPVAETEDHFAFGRLVPRCMCSKLCSMTTNMHEESFCRLMALETSM